MPTAPGPPTTVDAGALLAPIEPVPPPATTIVEPTTTSSSSSSAPPRAVLPRGTATSESRDRPLASLWWPGAIAVALGALSIVGARRTRREPAPAGLDPAANGAATVHDDATVKHDVLVDLEAAEREADAPAERMAVQLERLRTTAPPVPRRRSHL